MLLLSWNSVTLLLCVLFRMCSQGLAMKLLGGQTRHLCQVPASIPQMLHWRTAMYCRFLSRKTNPVSFLQRMHRKRSRLRGSMKSSLERGWSPIFVLVMYEYVY